jgi:hypothetical protein
MTRQYIKSAKISFSMLLIAACGFIPQAARAQEGTETKMVNTAVPMLRIAPDARAAAMGETGITTSADGASIFYNAAKTVFAKNEGSYSLNYVNWLKQITPGFYMLSLSGYHKLDEKQAVSGSIRYYNTGKVEERDNNNTLLQLANPNEFAIDAGYARTLSNKISLALTFRYIRSSIGKTIDNNGNGAGSAFTGDIAAFYNGVDQEGQGFTAGLILANVGASKINQGNGNSGFIPARIGAGAGYTYPLDEDSRLSFSTELNKSLAPLIPDGPNGMEEYSKYSVFKSYSEGLGNSALSISAGAEYNYRDLFFARAGYFSESKAYGGRKYLSAGVGATMKQFGFTFAYIVPTGKHAGAYALSNTLHFGLSFTPASSNQ